MSSHAKPRYTPAEYLALERQAEHRSAYFGGEIFAMGGASEQHNLIVTNTVRELSLQLKGRPCKTYASDMRVRVRPTGLYTYPDIVVVCGKALFDDEEMDTLLNPTVIVEVLSKSTEGYDRGEKFAHYRKLDSLAEYVLISQERIRVERYGRQPEGQWLLSEADSVQDRVEMPSIQCTLAMSEVYDKVEF